MPRKLRVQYPGAIYHLMNRGDRREDIFEDDQDRQDFLKTLAQARQKTGWQVHAYCLMRNHYLTPAASSTCRAPKSNSLSVRAAVSRVAGLRPAVVQGSQEWCSSY
jgi:REP element-mobilizing transposase RayT